MTDLRWMTPLITTAYAHVETFAVARLPAADRAVLMQDAARIFGARWLPLMRREVVQFRALRPALEQIADSAQGIRQHWLRRRLQDVEQAIVAIMQDQPSRPATVTS